MTIKKDKAIQKILSQFSDFSNLILEQLDLLTDIVKEPTSIDKQEIKEALEKAEKKIDSFEVKISELIIKTIVLHKPVASDLRKIMACYRMIINMERIGDRVINISNYISSIEHSSLSPDLSGILNNMLTSTSKMVEDALFSFMNDEKDVALAVIKNDATIDKMDNNLLLKTLEGWNLSDETKEIVLSFINIRSILSNIERIADHATNIAEASIYSMEGKDVRHKKLSDLFDSE